MTVAQMLAVSLVRGYQLTIAAVLPQACRFYPSCSHYAIEAVHQHGALRGGALAAWRLARCHPWGGEGYDPVPVKRPSDVAAEGTPATTIRGDTCCAKPGQ